MEISTDLVFILIFIVGFFSLNRYLNQQQAKAQTAHFETLVSKQTSPEVDLEGRFADVSAKQMERNTAQLLTLAQQRFDVDREKNAGELKSTKDGIENLLKPIVEQLGALQNTTKAMEKERSEAYGDIKSHIQQLSVRTDLLGKEANNLTTALTKSSGTRGNWGEVSLSNIFEMSGLREGIDFVEQEGQDDGKRPDFIVNLPGGGRIPIDAKATAKHFLEAIDQDDDESRKALIAQHAKAMRGRVNELKSKGYRDSVGGDVEHVIMFVPSEALLAVTFDTQSDLHEFAMKNDILIASPVSLLALLRTIAFQWRQSEQAENTREALAACRELYKRFATWTEHYEKVGQKLTQMNEHYNSSVGSFQRLNPQIRKLEDLRINEDLGKTVASLSETSADLRALPESIDLDGQ
ncbi:MAG: DNA recombination protein RmuC [Candidatus Poseidoniaceae archaeon]|jgi:DNA recombination protein RmuC|tara:strand:+ start:10026 stop:11249 length:1224 start_codon:yes stop_codon:yes gene_type:complete